MRGKKKTGTKAAAHTAKPAFKMPKAVARSLRAAMTSLEKAELALGAFEARGTKHASHKSAKKTRKTKVSKDVGQA